MRRFSIPPPSLDPKHPEVVFNAARLFHLLARPSTPPHPSVTPGMTRLGNQFLTIWTRGPEHTDIFVRTVLSMLRMQSAGERSRVRGYADPAIYTRPRGSEGTSCGILHGTFGSYPLEGSTSRIRPAVP